MKRHQGQQAYSKYSSGKGERVLHICSAGPHICFKEHKMPENVTKRQSFIQYIDKNKSHKKHPKRVYSTTQTLQSHIHTYSSLACPIR